MVGTAFANPLAVTVTVVNNTSPFVNPVAGGVVTYTVNPAANGASATLALTIGTTTTTGTKVTATIGANGQAGLQPSVGKVTATANVFPGTYSVSASAAGATSASFSLDNLYRIVPQFDTTKANNSGSTVPIKIQLTNGLGQNAGSSSLPVTAVSVMGPSLNLHAGQPVHVRLEDGHVPVRPEDDGVHKGLLHLQIQCR